MAQPDSDDLADALSKLAGGEIAPSEQEPPAPQAQPPRSPASAPSAPKPAAKPATRPAAASARPSAARPQRPTAPAPRPAAPAKAAPPSTNFTSPETPLDVDLSSEAGLALPPEQQEIIDDDDAVNMPAPDAAVFAPRPHARKPAPRRGRAAVYQTIEFRRTIIPILLTCGTLMIAFGSLKYTLGQDSALAELPAWLPIVLFITGSVLLALAVVNMLSVKHQLVDVKK